PRHSFPAYAISTQRTFWAASSLPNSRTSPKSLTSRHVKKPNQSTPASTTPMTRSLPSQQPRPTSLTQCSSSPSWKRSCTVEGSLDVRFRESFAVTARKFRHQIVEVGFRQGCIAFNPRLVDHTNHVEFR